MKNLIPRKFKIDLLPPHLVAFLTGVLLALIVGIIFRKIIDKMSVTKIQTAQSTVVTKKEESFDHKKIQPDNTLSRDSQKPELKTKKMSAKQEPADAQSSTQLNGTKTTTKTDSS